MSDVIGFTDFLEHRGARASRHQGSGKPHLQNGFTKRDREDLEDWSSENHLVSICASDMGPFAMVYEAGRPWASWGVVRQARSILVWDCVTLADIGRYPSMFDALAAIPVDEDPTPVANVIQFVAARLRTAAAG